MVKIAQLETNVSVAPQLAEADFAEISRRDFRSVVNNRPDGEEPGQLRNAQAEAAARREGLTFRYQPVANMDVTDEAVVDDFARLMSELPGPILFYCRSGTRCTTLWAQASAGRLGVSRTLEIAAVAGYDLAVLRDQLEECAGRAVPSAATWRAEREAVSSAPAS